MGKNQEISDVKIDQDVHGSSNHERISRQAFTEFIFRVFLWNLPVTVMVSKNEEERINRQCSQFHSLDNHEKFHKIIVWRDALMKAIIPLGLTVAGFKIFSTIKTFDYYSDVEYYYNFDFKVLTNLGGASLISNAVLSELTIFVGLCLALYHRFNLAKSSKMIRWSFVLLLLIKLWPSIVQSDLKLALNNIMKEVEADKTEASIFVARFRFQGTLKNIIELIPLIIAFPRGAIGAAMALLALTPKAVTPRILLLYFFPFATLLLVLGTSSMVQLAGDYFLAASLICFYISDFLVYLMLGAIIESNIEELSGSKKSKARLYTKILGILLFFTWIFVKLVPCASELDADNAHCKALELLEITPIRVVNILFSFFRNLFLTKLVFADFIIPTMVRCEPNISGLDHIYNTSSMLSSDTRDEEKES